MFSTKFWFTLVTLAMAISVALLLLSRSSYNLAREDDTRRLLLKDRDQAWALLKSEARVRLDELLRVAGDQDVLRILGKASATPEKIDSDDRTKLTSALARQNTALESYAGDLLVAVDREGTAIAQVWDDGPDKVGYGLGGFPVVRSALRGFMQDDVLAFSTDATNPNKIKVYRVASRPVIRSGQYVGAIVHGQLLDTEFAATLSKRLGAQVVFFRGPVVIASGLPDRAEPLSEQMVATPIGDLLQDDAFIATGRSGIEKISDDCFAVYGLVMGEAALVEGANVGYAVVRKAPVIASPLEIVTAASLEEWKGLLSSTPGIFLIVGFVLVLAFGFVFFSVEHGRPVRGLKREVAKLASREVDRLNIYAVSRPYRQTAESINKAMDKAVADVAEKLGKKSASIDSILGPRAGGERVSSALFTFNDGQEDIPPPPPQPPPQPGPPGAGAPPPGMGAPPPGMGGPPPEMGAPPPNARALGGPQAPPPSAPMPSAGIASPALGAPLSPPEGPLPSPGGEEGDAEGLEGVTTAPPSGGQELSNTAMTSPKPPQSQSLPGAPSTQQAPMGSVPSLYGDEEDDEDKTEVAGVPEELLIASQRDELPEPPDETTYFREIFDQFINTKKQCSERVDNLQFERFSQTLRKNRDALIERYGCKTVRFQVYVKEGKAALKATPVKA